ncbi:MAG: signal recognition particle [Betaproteobacteria bacterium]|nr:signal recognition particle [Betaproteobacteria bacterium]
MSYVDAFVVPVPKKKLDAYRSMARTASKVWRDHGALEYVESVADDVKPGKVTSFPQSVKLKEGETVVFAYVVYKSRAQRDRVMAKVMKDPRLASMMDPKKMPFDAKRMFWGGFKAFVKA